MYTLKYVKLLSKQFFEDELVSLLRFIYSCVFSIIKLFVFNVHSFVVKRDDKMRILFSFENPSLKVKPKTADLVRAICGLRARRSKIERKSDKAETFKQSIVLQFVDAGCCFCFAFAFSFSMFHSLLTCFSMRQLYCFFLRILKLFDFLYLFLCKFKLTTLLRLYRLKRLYNE